MTIQDDGVNKAEEQAEGIAWERAVAKASKKSYQYFIDQYPDSVRASVARTRLAATISLKSYRSPDGEAGGSGGGERGKLLRIVYSVVVGLVVFALILLGKPQGVGAYAVGYGVGNTFANIIIGLLLAYPLTMGSRKGLRIPVGMTAALILSGVQVGYSQYVLKSDEWSAEVRRQFVDQCSVNSESMRSVCVCFQKEIEAKVTQVELARGEVFFDSPKGKQSVTEANQTCGVGRVRQFQEGMAAYKAQDYSRTLRLMRPLAEQGFSQAEYMVGLIFLNGLDGSPNKDDALMWLNKAAGHGDPDAAKVLAQLTGDGGPKPLPAGKSGVDQDKRPPSGVAGAPPAPSIGAATTGVAETGVGKVPTDKQEVSNSEAAVVAITKVPSQFIGRWAATKSNSPVLYAVMRNCDVFNIEFTEKHTYMYIQAVCDSVMKNSPGKLYCGDVRLFSKMYLSGASLVGVFDASVPGGRRAVFTPNGDGTAIDVKWGVNFFTPEDTEGRSISFTLGKCGG